MKKRPIFPALFRHASPAVLVARAALLAALAAFAGCLLQARLLPALGTDSLIYHLAIPALWRQTGFLAPTDLPFHDGAAEHSPMLSQALIYLLMRAAGDDGLAWLVQPAFLLVTWRLFFMSARLMGLARGGALLLTAMLALFPPFGRSAQLANNELVLTCGAALAVYGLLRTRLAPRRGLLLAAGGIALMLLGKTVGLIYALAAGLLLLAAAAALLRRSQGAARRRLLWALAWSALIVLAGGAFYWRNWLLHGNPLYPAEFRVLGAVIFPGLYDNSAAAEPRWSRAVLERLFFDHSNTLAITWPYGLALWSALLVFAGRAVLRRPRRLGGWLRIGAGLGFPLGAALLLLVLSPFLDQRLVFPVYYGLWLAAAGALAGLGRRLRRAPRWLPALLLWSAAVLSFAYQAPWLAGWFWAAVAAALALAWLPWRRLRAPRVRLAAAAAALTALGLWLWLDGANAGRRADRAEMRAWAYPYFYGAEGQAWQVVDELGREQPGLTVAYAGSAMIYPLFGPRLDRRVVYVPTSALDRPRPLDPAAEGSVVLRLALARRSEFDEKFWLEGLRARRVDLLLLVDDPARGGVAGELAAAGRHPADFKPLFHDGRAYLFRVQQQQQR